MRFSLLPFASALFTFSAIPAQAQTWTTATPLPAPNAGHAMASWNGYLYAFGGSTDPLMSCRFDTVAGTAWEPLAPPPAPLPGAAAASHQGILYVFSGSAIHAYDAAADRWATLTAALAAPRTWASAARLGNRIYLAGGNSGTSTAASFEELTPNPTQPALGTVRARAMLPEASRGALAAVDNRLYYLYYSAAQARWSFTSYDPAPDRWAFPTSGGVWLDPAERPACFGLNSTLYFAAANTTSTITLLYEWRVLQTSFPNPVGFIPGPVGRRFLAGTESGNRGWISGGETAAGPVDMVQRLTPPAIGTPPSASDGAMRVPGGPALPPGSAIAGTALQFTATLTDPDSIARLEVEVCPVNDPFGGAPSAMSSYVNPALATPVINWTVAPGAWKWRYRAKDQWGNNSPWIDFGDADGMDFLYDAAPPGTPSPLSPVGVEVPVNSPLGGAVPFSWTAATDDASGVASYEIEVSRDPYFADGVFEGGSASESASITLPPHREAHHWRVRAIDFAGRVGAWSATASFRVVLVDGIDHGAGDAPRVCGFAAPAGARTAWAAALLALTSLAATLRAPRARAAGRGSRA